MERRVLASIKYRREVKGLIGDRRCPARMNCFGLANLFHLQAKQSGMRPVRMALRKIGDDYRHEAERLQGLTSSGIHGRHASKNAKHKKALTLRLEGRLQVGCRGARRYARYREF
jgi:hypothetical protein